MPWKESCAVDERHRFMEAFLKGDYPMTELCERFGISRKTGYKWRDRHAASGLAGLAERSHAPHRPAHATAPEIVNAIIAFKLDKPRMGPRMILDRLRIARPDVAWPSDSTGGEILKRAGLVSPRRKHRRAPARPGPLTEPARPNHVWATDHKGWVRLGDGVRCEPLTIADVHSRYLIGLAATASTRESEARPCFERAFHEYGLPEVIRSDNGPPFASTGVSGLTALSAWWTKLGIHHERIDPGKPQQNGVLERFHLTLKEAMEPASADLNEQTRRFEAFRQDYNEARPHQASGRKPPAWAYRPSHRAMPRTLPEPDYPAEAAVRQVRSNGVIKWRGDLVMISSALVGEPVCIEEDEAGEWRVRFYARPLGLIDRHTNRLRAPRVFKDAWRAQSEDET